MRLATGELLRHLIPDKSDVRTNEGRCSLTPRSKIELGNRTNPFTVVREL
jgi:hypothetical protein